MSGDVLSPNEQIVFSTSDQSQLQSLMELLRTAGGLDVRQVPGTPGPGEQGTLDVLSVLAGSSVLTAAFGALPQYIRSKRSGFSITMTVRGEPLTMTATNIDDVLPVLAKLLDD